MREQYITKKVEVQVYNILLVGVKCYLWMWKGLQEYEQNIQQVEPLISINNISAQREMSQPRCLETQHPRPSFRTLYRYVMTHGLW